MQKATQPSKAEIQYLTCINERSATVLMGVPALVHRHLKIVAVVCRLES